MPTIRSRLVDAHHTIRELRNELLACKAPLEQRIAVLAAENAKLSEQNSRLRDQRGALEQALAGLVAVGFRRLASGKVVREGSDEPHG